MSDDKPTRADIARANGAKSRGPITPQGKARSSHNGIRHGLLARQVVLPDEPITKYRTLLKSHIEQFQPKNAVESELVAVMAVRAGVSAASLPLKPTCSRTDSNPAARTSSTTLRTPTAIKASPGFLT